MVRGINRFRDHFRAFSDRYIVIGGTASSIAMENVGGEFRGTKDIDIVLYVESLDTGFVKAFWEFVKLGGYEGMQEGAEL